MDQWEISLLTCTELDLQCQAGTGRNETELDRKSDVGRSEQFATNLNRSTQGRNRQEGIQFDSRGAPMVYLHGARPETELASQTWPAPEPDVASTSRMERELTCPA